MTRRTLSLCASLLATALLAGCVTGGGPTSTAATNSTEIRDQLFKLQKDSARIISQLEELGAGPEQASAQAVCAEALTRLTELQQEVRIVEEQLIATQARLDEVLTQLRALRRTPTRSWAAEATPPQQPSAGATEVPVDNGEPTGETGTEPGSEESALLAAAPEDLFNAAYADYSRGQFDLALAGFDGTLRADPEGPLADDAQYWIGETLFAQKRYLDAAAAFEHLISGWPEGDKAVRARLKRGIALFEARRTTEAVQILEDVITNWPASDEARIAQEYFRRKGIVSE